MLAQVAQRCQAVAIREVEVQQDQMKIGMRCDEPHRLAAIGCLEHGCVVLQFPENAAQRVANQGVIVDHQDLHGAQPVAACCEPYVSPGPKASAACFHQTATNRS